MKKTVAVGIEIGTNKSSMAYEEVGKIYYITNSLGEDIESSVVSIIKENAFSGENVYLNEKSNFNNTITDIKRLISLNFINDDEYLENYKKYLSYNIEKTENKSLVINIEGKKYSIETVLSFLIKQIIDNRKNNFIFAKKYIFTIPSCFGIQERLLIKKAAQLAEIDESRIIIINETSAAALAYELFVNQEKFNLKYNYNIFKLDDQLTEGNLTSGPALNMKFKKNILVFDLGAGCFNLSILTFEQNEKKINVKVKANLGNPFFGGIDFDNRLVDFCIQEFCKLTKIREEDIFKNKNAIKRLKLRCEIAKKILDKEDSIIIFIKDFINNKDLCIEITRDNFNSLFLDYYIEIENKVKKILKMANMNTDSINDVLVIGGNSKIPKILENLKDKFGQNKVIDYIDHNKIVITGAALYGKEIQKKNKIFYLNEIISSTYGINIINNDKNTYVKYGDKMMKFIRKNSNLSSEKTFKFLYKISNENKIFFNIYEGESNFVKFNKKLSDILIKFNEPMRNKQIQLYIKFELDINYVLKITVDIPKKINKEIKIGIFDKTKLVKSETNVKTNEFNTKFINIKKELQNYLDSYVKFKDEERNRVLINGCKCCDEILNFYEKDYNAERKIIKIYQFTEELFVYYFERLKIEKKSVNDNNIIIERIKERMKYLMNIEGFNEMLINKFKELSNINRNLYYTIILNYIELKVSENINILKIDKKSGTNYFNLYFNASQKILVYFSNEMNIYETNEELLQKIEFLKKINLHAKNLNNKNEYQNLQNTKNQINNLIKKNKIYNLLNDLFKLINELEILIK